jgi:hypothetical protein
MAAFYVSLPYLPSLFDVVDPAAPTVSLITSSIRPVWGNVSPDNTLLANVSDTGTDNGVELWSLPSMAFLSSQAIGDHTRGVVFSPDSQHFYVQTLYGIVAYTRAGLFIPSSPWAANGPVAGFGNCIAVSPDNTRVYACGIDNVSCYDATSGATLAMWMMTRPCSLALSPDGSTLYVTDNAPNPCKLYVIDTTTGGGTLGAGMPLGVGYAGLQTIISPDGSKLYIAAITQVLVVTTSTFAISSIGVGINVNQCVLSRDGLTLWATDQTNKRIVPVDVASGATGIPINVDDQPVGIAAVPPLAPLVPVPVTASVALGPLTVTATSSVIGTTVTGTAVLNIGPFTVTAHTTLETRTGTAAVALGPLVVAALSGRIGPGAHPIPGFRGRWRLTLHTRKFAPATLASTIIAELAGARGRRLDQAWNTPATLTFTLDGRAQAAGLVQELLHDVVAWRFDDQTGLDIPVFRGPVTQAEDQITTDSHTVTYTCHDYAAMLTRRLITSTYSVTARDQDLIVDDLLARAVNATNSLGLSFSPASFLPLSLFAAYPGGGLRGLSGQLRTRTYYGSQNIGTAIDDLSKVINGFDFDVQPSAVNSTDSLRVFYPAQGVNRTGIALQYGSTVAGLTRSVNSGDYANYVRVLGNNSSTSPTPQLYSDNWMAEAQSSTPTVGLWMADDNAADVTVQATLDDKSLGDVLRLSDLEPSYTLTLTPDAYTWGNPNMGDTVPLIVQSGRLNVNTAVRVLGITYDIGDDGQEDVSLVVGRPRQSLAKMFAKQDRGIKALDRR